MYKLPKNIDLTFLKGCELTQICIGAFQVQFNFDKHTRIYVTNDFTYVNDAGVENHYSAQTVGILVNKLLGKIIAAAYPQEDGTLELVLSNSEKLVFHDDDSGYECYEIRHGDNIIVV